MSVSDPTPPEAGQWFSQTQWVDIKTARERDSLAAQAAMERLCQTYWRPLFVYIRRRGFSHEQAQDLTQGFFTWLLESNLLEAADPAKGKFRNLLMSALVRYLSDRRDFDRAKKRGGGKTLLSFDEEIPETVYQLPAGSNQTPEQLFDQEWARTVMEQAREQLAREYGSKGKSALFDALSPFLTTEPGPGEYEILAEKLDTTPGALTTAVHRLRHRFGDCIDAQIAGTVGSAAEIAGERRYLFQVLALE